MIFVSHFSIAPGCARVRTCTGGFISFLSTHVYGAHPMSVHPLLLLCHRVGIHLTLVGWSWKFLIVSQVTALCRNLLSRPKAVDGLIPLARVGLVGGRYSPQFTCCLSGWSTMFMVTSHALTPPFPLLSGCDKLTSPLQWESCATKYHRWNSPGLLPFLLFGVAVLMMRSVPKFCSLVIEKFT